MIMTLLQGLIGWFTGEKMLDSSGKRVVTSAGKRRTRNSVGLYQDCLGCECCPSCSCSNCRCTPTSVTVTFSGWTAIGCSACTMDGGLAHSASGTLDGTYDVPFDAACGFQASGISLATNIVHNVYADLLCALQIVTATYSFVWITVSRASSTTWLIYAYKQSDGGGGTITGLQDFFNATATTSSLDCSTSISALANTITGNAAPCGTHPGGGGTADATFNFT